MWLGLKLVLQKFYICWRTKEKKLFINFCVEFLSREHKIWLSLEEEEGMLRIIIVGRND